MNVLRFDSMYIFSAPLDIVLAISQATSPMPMESGIIKKIGITELEEDVGQQPTCLCSDTALCFSTLPQRFNYYLHLFSKFCQGSGDSFGFR